MSRIRIRSISFALAAVISAGTVAATIAPAVSADAAPKKAILKAIL